MTGRSGSAGTPGEKSTAAEPASRDRFDGDTSPELPPALPQASQEWHSSPAPQDPMSCEQENSSTTA